MQARWATGRDRSRARLDGFFVRFATGATDDARERGEELAGVRAFTRATSSGVPVATTGVRRRRRLRGRGR